MSEINTTSARKPWTIKDAYIADKHYVEQYQAENRLSVGEALHKVIEAGKQAKNTETPPVNSDEITKLTELNQSLLEQIRTLKEENAALTEIHSTSLAETEQQRESLVAEISQLKQQVKGLSDKLPRSPQFVCTFKPELITRMRKVRPFLKKDGIIKNDDPSEIAEYSVNYFIKEEYSHIK
jgi:hypothetical protein